MGSVRFRLLGPLGVDSEAGPVDLGPPKQRAVLAVLLLHANEIVPTDRIIDLVWGESPPRTAEHAVQIYISNLRKALSDVSPTDLIETRPPGYLLNVPPDAVDALRFQRLVREGLAALRAGEVAGGRPKLEGALAAWTAAPLAEFAYDDFAQGHIRSLEELRSDALESLAGVHLDQGHIDGARDFARQAIAADPLREEPRRVMMLALYRSGRQTEALRHYGDYQKLLGEELGIEPSEHLRELEERVLLQDPTLDPQAPAHTAGNPYRGLRAFSENDADMYFGRESLVAEVLEKLDRDSGFVSIVGPSGSGKSSAAQAGVIPVLRARGDTVVLFTPGPRPLWELATALDRAGFGSRATLLRRFERDPSSLASMISRRAVLMIDQFEELFTLAEPETAARFSELVATAVEEEESPLRVVATLRADYYDRPLSLPSLAGVFSNSVVSVKPMTTQEIERAVVEPARAAGVEVEPALLAQLVADMGGKPGALPLFQFTLFELFERTSDGLTLADYQQLGGLQGALTSRADELLEELDAEGRDLVEQLMIRMVQRGRTISTARPARLRDLLDLGIDPVALQAVLEAFGSRRLLTFDRDASGAAVVEIAHEYLISEWPQLATWIEQHSEDLDRLYALDAATEEWKAAGRSEDYLLRGDRLKGFEIWRESTSLRLTRREAEFLDASVGLRDREEAAEAEHAAREAALARRARRRLWAFGTAVAALTAAVSFLVVTLIPEPPPDVILWAAPADTTFGGLMATGLHRAAEEHGLDAEHVVEDPTLTRDVRDRLSRGTGLVLLSTTLGGEPAVHDLISEYPNTTFVWIDCQRFLVPEELRENETCMLSRHEEMGFLAGVVAAHKTEVGHVGIVVGFDDLFMHPFQEGFEQGVAYVDPTITVSHVYLSPFFWDGFDSPTLGWLGAQTLIHEGADVVFHAAGDSGVGVFEAVHGEAVRSGRTLWAIGVDVDEHSKFEEWKSEPWAPDFALAGWQAHTLTSIVKRLDVMVFETVESYFTTGRVAGALAISIESGGIDYVTTGGFVDDIVPMLEAAKEDIRSGSFELVVHGVDEVRYVRDLLAP
jgi:DNA-binding SARP family transcriptional activator/basic membrane lipoprotein Med (substrate-binding protein (PBP1-ABC) superfamily)